MSILDRAKSHFENIGVQSIEVPEWKDEDFEEDFEDEEEEDIDEEDE